MEKGPKPFIPKESESIEEKKERLMPIFQESFDVFCNPDIDLREGALLVKRRRLDGAIEEIPNLVVVDINEDGPNLCGIDESGEPTASATMLWKEIINAKK